MSAAASRSKPLTLRRMGDIAPLAFELLKEQYHIDDRFFIDLTDIAVDDPEVFRNPIEIAPFTMRKLQLLYHLAVSDEVTTNHIAVQLLLDIHRSIAQLKDTVAEKSAASLSMILDRLDAAIIEVGEINRVDKDLSPGDTVELY